MMVFILISAGTGGPAGSKRRQADIGHRGKKIMALPNGERHVSKL
jgi:hypothetical protein